MSLAVKTERDPSTLISGVRGALRAVDPEVPAAQVRDMETVIARSVSDRRLNAVLIGTFGALALALAAIGLYGVMAYSVSQRTREIGVRIAMGAPRRTVLRLVVGEGTRLVAIGVALGLAVSLLIAGSLARLLYGVEPRDASVIVLASLILLVAGALASYLPALRATRVDPVVALRAE